MKKQLFSIVLSLAILLGSVTVLGFGVSAAAPIDVTADVTIEDAGTIISADTTTFFIKLGNHSCLPENGAGFYSNDNPATNGIDVLNYIEINGKTARQIVTDNQNGVTAYTGTAFPMNVGGIYSPVMEFCEAPYFRVSVLNGYAVRGTFTVALKSGFTWKNNNGETLTVSSDVTYAYGATGGLVKISDTVDLYDELTVADYVTTQNNPEYVFIDLRTDMLTPFTGYDYSFFDTAYGAADLLPFVEINGKTLEEIKSFDISGYNTTWTLFPATASATYRTAVLPFAETGNCIKLRILKAWLNDFTAQYDNELVITLKQGLRSVIGTTMYVNSAEKTYTYDAGSGTFLCDGEEPVEHPLTLTAGTIVKSADYSQVGILVENGGDIASVGYYFSEQKANYPNVTANLFVNGKSVAQINEEYDGSYTYTEFPATVGRAYQDPVYLFADNGVIWVKIAKEYLKTLPADFEITFGGAFGYTLNGKDYTPGRAVTFTVEKNGRDNLRWLDYTDTVDFSISAYNNAAADGYQSFNMVFDHEIPAFATVAYDGFTDPYYAMTERIFVGGRSIAQINAETPTTGYSFNYFPASAIDSFKLPIILYVSGNNMELKINSAYYNALGNDFSVILSPDFFAVLDGTKYALPDGFNYIANKAKIQPKLLGGTTEYLDLELGANFYPSAAVGTVFPTVGGEVALRIREANSSTSVFGGLTLSKKADGIYKLDLSTANVVNGAILTVDAAYMLGTQVEYVGPACFIYQNGWHNMVTASGLPAAESLVANGTFDSGISGWTLNNAADTVSSYSNGFSGKGIAVTHAAASGEKLNGITSASFALEADTAYRVFAHVFVDGKTYLGAAVKSGGNTLASCENFAVLKDNSDGWKLFEFRFKTDSAATAVLSLNQRFFGEDAAVVYDDVIVCKDFAPGDVNADGVIDVRDLVRYKRVLGGSAEFFESGLSDLNADDRDDLNDVVLLQQIILGFDITPYVYEKQSFGTELRFYSGDENMDTFLNDFRTRHFGVGENAVRKLELGYSGTAWKAWEAMSLLWYDSTTDNYATDKFADMRSWLYGIPVDSYGYTWSSENTLENPTATPTNVFGIGWPFPNYGAYRDYDWEFNSGDRDGWSVSGASSSTVTGGYLKANVSGTQEVIFQKTELSPFISTDESPFLEMDLRWTLNTAAVEDVTVSWKTSLLGSWKSVSVKEYSILEQTFGKSYGQHLYLPMYLNSGWGNNKNIYGLKITVAAKEGMSLSGNINLNYVRGNLDSRQIDNAYNLLETARLYQEYTGDIKTLRDNLNRYRSAVLFLAENLADSDGLIDLSNFEGHDGGIMTDGRNHTIASSYWDVISLSPKSVYAQALYYKCLEDLAYLESVVAENGITVTPTAIRTFDNTTVTYDYTAADLQTMAANVKTAVRQPVNTTAKTGYFNESTGRFIEGFNRSGNMVDYGSVIFNNMVVSFGMATDAQAASVLSWINGTRTVAGDTVTGSGIYEYDFAPRTTTVKNDRQYVADYSPAEANAPFGSSVQDGGAVLFTTYYDIMARMKYAGTQDAYERFSAVKDWYLDVLEAYNNSDYDEEDFYRAYYDALGITLQGGGTSGALGIDREFVESAILCTVVPDAFFGLSGQQTDTLTVSPDLPEELDFWRMENLMFRQVKYDLEIGQNYVILEEVSGNTYGLSLKLTMKTALANPKVYINGTELDPSAYTVSAGKVTVTTSFAAKKIEVR